MAGPVRAGGGSAAGHRGVDRRAGGVHRGYADEKRASEYITGSFYCRCDCACGEHGRQNPLIAEMRAVVKYW